MLYQEIFYRYYSFLVINFLFAKLQVTIRRITLSWVRPIELVRHWTEPENIEWTLILLVSQIFGKTIPEQKPSSQQSLLLLEQLGLLLFCSDFDNVGGFSKSFYPARLFSYPRGTSPQGVEVKSKDSACCCCCCCRLSSTGPLRGGRGEGGAFVGRQKSFALKMKLDSWVIFSQLELCPG